MGRRVVSGGCHSAEQKNGDFAALRRLSPDGEELDGGGARVRELHPQVRAARGGSSSHLIRSQEVAVRGLAIFCEIFDKSYIETSMS
ncbi:unnamed protein product [Spirodela intermedia]|uniref:Uncharacterized protein n=1 Tax=Spirodela intermedia TaxID=51605 RepID=A0A811G503_SPIIN|nr:unnamed protein product [Spirodela intermedia]